MRAIHPYTFAILMLAVSTVQSAPNTGDIAAAGCVSCHGSKGEGNAEAGFPALAQLPEKYFIKQIADYRAGTRTNAKDLNSHEAHATPSYGYYVSFMKSVAKSISPDDAAAAARYFSGLTRPVITSAKPDPAVLARGKELALNGAWDRQIPPCFKCHAVSGQGVGQVFPPIAGQHAAYTVRQLQAWKTGVRTNDPQQLMKTTAENLTDDEIRAVAEYLSTLSGGEKRP